MRRPRVRPGRPRLRDGRDRRRRASPARTTPTPFNGADLSTKLKLLGVDVASASATRSAPPPAPSTAVFADAAGNVLQEARRHRGRPPARRRSWSATPQAYDLLSRWPEPRCRCPAPAGATAARGAGRRVRPAALPDSATICSCHNVSKGALLAAVLDKAAPRQRAEVVHEGRDRLRVLRPDCSARSWIAAGIEVDTAAVRALPAHPRRALRDRAASSRITRSQRLLAEHGTGDRGLRDLQAGGRLDPRLTRRRARRPRPHPVRRAGRAAGHQRPLPGQHAEERLVLGRAPDPRRRDHPGQAHRDRRGRPRLRALHQDHRRAADRPARRPGRAAPGDLAPAGRRRVRVRPRLWQGAANG